MALKRALGPHSGALYGGGLTLVLLGERVVPTIATVHYALTGAGIAALVGSAALRFMAAGQTEGDRRAVERALGLLTLLALVAVAVMLSTTDAGEQLTGLVRATTEKRARFEGAATIAWVVLGLIATLPLAFAEVALHPMRRAPRIEGRRVVAAAAAGLTLAFALVYAGLFTYGVGELEVKADFSYFRTARASESTRAMAASLTEPLKITAFFPQLNDVGREVSGYLRDVAQGASNVTVETQDRLLVPALAKELKVTADGVVVLARGKVHETLTIGTDLNAARPKLKTLDADFQKTLLKAMREQKTAYFTIGHGEFNEAATSPEGRSAAGTKKLLEGQSYVVKDLGMAQGLGNEVPSDASVVIVLGPSQALLPGEVDTLHRYAERGGHLLLALDPDAKVDLDPLAAIAGLTWAPAVLVNDKLFLRRNYNDSDKTILATNRYSSHASVSTLSRNSMRAPAVFPGAASLDKRPGAPADLKVDFAIRSMPDTFADANGDFALTAPAEKRNTYNLGAAVSKSVAAAPVTGGSAPGPAAKGPGELRAFVVADADAFSDAALGNEPNILLFVDAIRWLGGEESFSGALSTTEDVKIEHTKQKDLVWFYSTIFGVPSLVLALGIFYNRRPRRAPAAGRAA